MATVKIHVSKDGKITYYIRVFIGFDGNGKKIEPSLAWKVPEGMKPKQIEKELQRQIMKFEEEVKNGSFFNDKTKFATYANNWLENNQPPLLAPKTYERYRAMLDRINESLGEHQLTKLQSHHIQEFYNSLRKEGAKKVGAYATSETLTEVMKQKSFSRDELAKLASVGNATVSKACKPDGHISIDSAVKIAAVLDMPVEELFKLQQNTGGLSEKTINHHRRLICEILTQAVRDGIIPYNVADKQHMKPLKVETKEAVFLDDEQAVHVLELLENEQLKWKTAMYLLIFSGVRRGELMGLEWDDIDFENRVIHIRRTSQYVSRWGIITKSPKNKTSFRTIKLSNMMFQLLEEYRSEWIHYKESMGSDWKEHIEIKTTDGRARKVLNDRLFIQRDCTPMNPDSVTDWTSNFVERNHLPHFSPHALRHTHATLLIAEGVPLPIVSRRLGHYSLVTTTKTYIHAIQAADEIASTVIDDKLNFHVNNNEEPKEEAEQKSDDDCS
jgi:integrase